MPGVDGIEATRRIMGSAAAPRVIVLTTFDRDEYVYEALRAGASAFLLKDAPEQHPLSAIRVAADGGWLVAPAVTRRLIERFVAGGGVASPGLGELTARSSTCCGSSRGDVERGDRRRARDQRAHDEDARGLRAVQLDLRNRVQAVVLAYESGLVRPGA